MVLDQPDVVDPDALREFDLLDDAAVVRLHVADLGQIGRQVEQSELHP
jgi:hypothetical protein